MDERGQAVFEVAVGAIVIVLVLVGLAELLSGLGQTSNSQRDVVIAQNLGTQEIATLRSEGASASGFPPTDASGTPSALANQTLSALSNATYGGTVFYTYVVGGWCTLVTPNASTVGTWSSYTSTTNTPTKTNPANYMVGVIVTWGQNHDVKATGTITIDSSGTHVISSEEHLVLTSLLAIPTGDLAPTPSSTATVCPAVLS